MTAAHKDTDKIYSDNMEHSPEWETAGKVTMITNAKMLNDRSPAELASLLCETQFELQSMSDKYLNCSKELIEEARRSQHYLRLLVDKRLQQKQTGSGSDDRKSAGDSSLPPLHSIDGKCTKGAVDDDMVETDGDAFVLPGGNSGCPLSVDDSTRRYGQLIATTAGGNKKKSTLETDDAGVCDTTMCREKLEISAEPFIVGKPPGKSTSTPSSLSRETETQYVDRSIETKDQQQRWEPKGRLNISQHLLDEAKVEMTIENATAAAAVATAVAMPILPAGVAYDLAEKVMQQNARLKKLLRKIVDAQGISLTEFLEKFDNADTIERQRLEIARLQSLTAQHRELLSANDSQLRIKCTALIEKVRILEHEATIRQALVDTYTVECDRLKQEVRRLTPPAKGASVCHPGATAAAAPNSADARVPQTTTSATAGTEKATVQQGCLSKELTESFIQLKTQYAEMEKLYKAKLEDVTQQLDTKTQLIAKLKAENKSQVSDAPAQNQCQSMLPCTATAESRQNPPPHISSLPHEGLVTDGASTEPTTSTVVEPSEQLARIQKCIASSPEVLRPLAPEDSVRRSSLVCRRCEKTFDDKTEYGKHCQKCVDDE